MPLFRVEGLQKIPREDCSLLKAYFEYCDVIFGVLWNLWRQNWGKIAMEPFATRSLILNTSYFEYCDGIFGVLNL